MSHKSSSGADREARHRRPSWQNSVRSDQRPPSQITHRSWSQAFSSQGFDSEAHCSVVEPAPRPDILRQLTRHSLESEITKSRSAKFASEQDNQMQFMIMRAEKTRQLQKRKLTMVIDPDSTHFLQILSWGVDSIFFVDMVLQFFTMYPKTTPRGIEWETDLRKIGIHYMRTWFFLDFVTLIPFDILSLTWNAANLKELKSIKVIRAVRLLKLTLGSCFTSVFATGATAVFRPFQPDRRSECRPLGGVGTPCRASFDTLNVPASHWPSRPRMRILKSSRWLHRLEIALSIPYQHLALLRFLGGLMLVCHWLSCFWAMCLHLVDDVQLVDGVEKPVPKWIDDIAASDLEFKIVTRDHPLRIYMASFYFCSYTMTSVGYGDLGPKNILERVVCTAIVLVAGLCWAQILGDVCAISSDMNAENQEFRKKMNSLNRMMQDDRNLPWIQKVSFFSQFINHMDRLESKGVDTEAFRACIADTSRQLVCGAFAQRESFGNVQILYILSKGLVILNSKVGTNGTVWGEDFVLADTSRYCVRIAVRRGVIAEARRLARESLEEERRKRLRSQLPHKDLERVPQPPPINELEVYSPAHMPGAMWTEDDELEKERLRVILQELTAELERQSANLRSLEEEHRPPDPQRHEEPPQTSPTLELPIEAQESLRPEEKTDGPSFPIASAPSSARSAASKERKTITFEPDAAWEVREYDGGEARNGLGTQSDSNWTMDGWGPNLTTFGLYCILSRGDLKGPEHNLSQRMMALGTPKAPRAQS
eukprot:g31778.t1